ncbi:MAG TPA: hypothetical protein VGE93_09780 [Bryobacteraceae bacterium]
MSDQRKKRIYVVGDPTIDWALEARTTARSADQDEQFSREVIIHWLPGGLFTIKAFLDGIVDPRKVDVFAPREPNQGVLRTFRNPYHHSFLVIERDDSDGMLRVHDHLGYGRGRGRPINSSRHLKIKEGVDNPSVIVVDDSGLAFRDRPKIWPEILRSPTEQKSDMPSSHPWIILKMTRDVAQGRLWRTVSERLSNGEDWMAHRLVAVTTASRLRDAGAAISRDMSWERCIEDVARELDGNGSLTSLAECQRLIISFGPSGILLVERPKKHAKPQFTLACHRSMMERAWADNHNKGTMFGYVSALCAALANGLAMDRSGREDFSGYLMTGLQHMQKIYEVGFSEESETSNKLVLGARSEVSEPDAELVKISKFHLPAHERLSILNQGICRDNKMEEARHIARHGEFALPQVPIGHFGELVVVDRDEIESLRAIRNLIANYCASVRLSKKPLAIALFGKPGSGKSFAVSQLIKDGNRPNQSRIEVINFNLSQFSSPKDLVGALHKVRDEALAGKIPLAFWDEFDTPLDGAMLGWLRYFLAPIQDGSFRQGETVHRIGPSIFVFGGGTHDDFESFNKTAEDADRESKIMDFVSRLRGYVNILGPERREHDPYCMLRRAIILNGLLTSGGLEDVKTVDCKYGGEDLEVSDGVLNAFLTISSYTHGTRSMEAILQMSRIRSGQPFLVSALPGRLQLDLHVNSGEEFLEIARNGDDGQES